MGFQALALFTKRLEAFLQVSIFVMYKLLDLVWREINEGLWNVLWGEQAMWPQCFLSSRASAPPCPVPSGHHTRDGFYLETLWNPAVLWPLEAQREKWPRNEKVGLRTFVSTASTSLVQAEPWEHQGWSGWLLGHWAAGIHSTPHFPESNQESSSVPASGRNGK